MEEKNKSNLDPDTEAFTRHLSHTFTNVLSGLKAFERLTNSSDVISFVKISIPLISKYADASESKLSALGERMSQAMAGETDSTIAPFIRKELGYEAMEKMFE